MSTLDSEDELLTWLRAQGAEQVRSIGDDAAILSVPQPFVVTLDAQIEGVHFPRGLAAADIARRLLAVNLSDLAAMGALPSHAFLSLSAPRDFDRRAFFTAFLAAARERDLELAGGDLSTQESISAVLVLHGGQHPGQRWLRRDAARPGDALWIGGPLGLAAAGLALGKAEPVPEALRAIAAEARDRQLLPRPQLDLGQWLAGRQRVAALDVSDGFARDLHRLCRASDVGAIVDWRRLPIDPKLTGLARHLDVPVRDLVLAGGEDYVLLFSMAADEEVPARYGATRIGEITAERSVSLLVDAGRVPLVAAGWDHLGGSTG